MACTSCAKFVCFDCYNDKGLLISCSGVWGCEYEGPTIVERCEDPKLFCVDCSKVNLSSKGFPVFQEYDTIMAEVGYPYMKSLMCGTCHSKAADAMLGQCVRCEDYVPDCPEDELGFTCAFCNNFYCGCCVFCKKSSCDCHTLWGMKVKEKYIFFGVDNEKKLSLDQWEDNEKKQCVMCQKQEMDSLYAANHERKLFPSSVLGVVKSFAIGSYFKNWKETTFENVMKKKSDENKFRM